MSKRFMVGTRLQVKWHVWGILALMLGCLLLAAKPSYAQTPEQDRETFNVAGQLYASGSYEEAVLLYQQLVDRGYEDNRLYYNLGNAYYESADFGNAILNYRRAMLNAPRDRDLRRNLQMAREKVVDQLKPVDESFLETFTQVGTWMTLSETAMLTLIAWTSIGVFIVLYRRPRSERQRTAAQSATVLATFTFVFLLILLVARMNRIRTRPAAVIVASEVDVVSEPSSASLPVFTLHSGAEVTVVEEQFGWYKLTLPGDELQGWIAADAIAVIEE